MLQPAWLDLICKSIGRHGRESLHPWLCAQFCKSATTVYSLTIFRLSTLLLPPHRFLILSSQMSNNDSWTSVMMTWKEGERERNNCVWCPSNNAARKKWSVAKTHSHSHSLETEDGREWRRRWKGMTRGESTVGEKTFLVVGGRINKELYHSREFSFPFCFIFLWYLPSSVFSSFFHCKE